MRDEDKLMKCSAEDIISLTKNTYENNLLKFVVLFGEDGYFLGTMRNGDESYDETIDTLVRRVDKDVVVHGPFRRQVNGPYFYGVFLTKRVNEMFSINFNVHRPEDGYITYGEYQSFKKFAEENKEFVGSGNCVISIDGKSEDFEGLKTEISCSINPKKEGRIFFSGANLPLLK